MASPVSTAAASRIPVGSPETAAVQTPLTSAPVPTSAPAPPSAPAPLSAPEPAPATPSTPTAANKPASDKDSGGASTLTKIVSSVASAVVTSLIGYALKTHCQRSPRGGDVQQAGDSKAKAKAKGISATAKPTNAKVQNSANVDLAADGVVQLAQIVLTNTKDKHEEEGEEEGEDS